MEDDMYSNEMFVKIRTQINSSLENQKEVIRYKKYTQNITSEY